MTAEAYNSLRMDPCYDAQQTSQMLDSASYFMYVPAVTRLDNPHPMPLAVGVQPTFYGQFGPKQVDQESFLNGLGQSLTKCGSCDIRMEPDSLFGAQARADFSQPYTARGSCQATDLQPLFTRLPRSCNGGNAEVSLDAFYFVPGAYQGNYAGPWGGVGGNLQTRMDPTDPAADPNVMNYSTRANYGMYGAGRVLTPYSL